MTYGCEEAIKDFNLKDECCASCHSELDDGYNYLTWIDEDENKFQKYYEICCDVRSNFLKAIKQ